MVCFHDDAWADYRYWTRTDRSMPKRINALIKDIQRSPLDGVGKPEPLKHSLTGFWSRRIDEEHRLVYTIDGERILIAQCRHHYAA